ncbi:MAG: hypothetical protein K2M09_00885, partial [Muribaculaceae bacterium]|nr:hypothetical protein [Muribaculaceae bacterium]
MKKLLLSALLAVGTLSNVYATDILIGDAKDDTYVYGADGLMNTNNANMGIAIRIPARTLQAYPGATIKGLQIAAGDGVDELAIEAFLSKGSLTDGKLTLSEPETSKNSYIGWIPNPAIPYTGLWD